MSHQLVRICNQEGLCSRESEEGGSYKSVFVGINAGGDELTQEGRKHHAGPVFMVGGDIG